MVLFLGAAVGYYSGDTRKVLDDAKELRPTVFAGVPRVYERVYSGVLDKVRLDTCGKQQLAGQQWAC
jgi:long-chain acyl-CoA synthetase